MLSWVASYRQLLREAQAKAAEATKIPTAKAVFEQQAKQWEVRLKEARALWKRDSGNDPGP